ncbi:MAG: DUF896 domain-containing protein [Firmicutes bacterium]|nr:DUF896 domain-containing protein [Bacillota bacterium]
MEQLIKRINELAKKAKTEGLSTQELDEQSRLRQEYLARFRQNFEAVLDNTVIMQPDGSKTPVKRKQQRPLH